MNKIKTVALTTIFSLFSFQGLQAEELKVWAWDPNFNVAAMEEATLRYQVKHPDFKLKVIADGKEAIEQKLHTMLASGVTSALPDIVLVEDYNAQKFIQAYPGSFAPMQKTVDYSKFAPYKVEVMTLGENIYGIPFDSGVAGLFYRRDILAKAGIKAEDLEDITWDEFIEIGKKVKKETGKYMLGFDVDNVVLPHIMMQSGGEWFFTDKGELNIVDNKALKETLQTLKKIKDSKIARPVSGWSEFVGTFNNGDVATVTSGVWMSASVKSVKEQSGLWGVAPIPRLNLANAVHASNQGGSSWYVLTTSKNVQGAIDFLDDTFGGDVEFYQKILVERGAVGTYLPASTGRAYQQADPFYAGQKVYEDFAKWISIIPKAQYGMFTQEADAAVATQIPALFDGMDIDEVLENINNALKYQIN